MSIAVAPARLRRYTDLPALLHMLTSRQITLLDPKTWDDKNDSFFMSLYKERKKLKTLLALCFSQTTETYHHWRVFSSGPAGVCIVFKRDALINHLEGVPGTLTKDVRYATLADARKSGLTTDELPFVKRQGFRPEREFRAVYTDAKNEHPSLNVPIDLSCIERISLSPWMHSSLRNSTALAINSIQGCETLKVSRSTLISNEQWKKLGRDAT